MPRGAWLAHARFGVPLAVGWRGACMAVVIAGLCVLLSTAPTVQAADEAASAPRDSRLHPRSLLAGDPLGALDGVRAQQTPTPEDDLPDVSLTLGGASHTVDVAGYFSDAVHGYEVTAAPNGIVRISRSGTEVTLEPVAVGSATVTVRGRKLRGSERKRFAVAVVAMVAAPTATGSIAALTLTEGVTHAVTASDYFEGAGITYTAASSDTAAATVEVAGADVTVKAVAAGSATITVTATNSGGSAEQRFAVTVLPPAPAPVGSIGAVTLAEGETHVEDVSAHFSGRGITYTAESSNAAVATVATEAAAVTVKAVAPGDATVTVTATNAGGSAGQSFAVTAQLPAVTLTRGDARTLELADHFGQEVTGYGAAVAPAGIVGLALTGSQLTLTALASGNATVTIEVTSADGTAEHRFAVTVLPPAPATVGSIEAVILAERETHMEDASAHFNGEGITYTAESSNEAVATVAVEGTTVTVTAVGAGDATVTLTATNAGGNTEQSFSVTVQLPSIILAEDGTRTIELADYFGADVTGYEVAVSPSGIVHASRSGSQLTLTALAAGSATVTVAATSPGGRAEQGFAVTVVPPAPRTVGSIEAVTIIEDATHAEDASSYFEGEGVTYAADSSDTEVATVEVDGSEVTVTAVAAGSATVTVTATNGGGSAEQGFLVTVVPPAPVAVGSIEAVTIIEDATHAEDAASYFEGEGVTYAADSSDEAVATVEVDGSEVTVTAVAAGSATVTVTATNGGGSAEQGFLVTVVPPAPVAVGSIEAVTIIEDATHAEDAASYFEGEGLAYGAVSSDTEVATVEVDGSEVTVTAVAAGSATVTVTATNGGGSAEQGFLVTVVPPAPVAVGSIEAVTIIEDATHAEDAASYFEGEGLVYGAVSSDTEVATVEVDGSEVTVTAVAAGSATVTVTATSPGGQRRARVRRHRGPARARSTVGSIEAVTVIEDATHAEDVASYFEGEGVTYAADSSDEAVATVEVDGSSVTVTAVAAGSATVTVTATNGGGSAEQGFAVTVVPPAPRTVGSIEAVTIIEGETHAEDVASYFEGEGLVYGAVSSDEAVAMVEVDGSEVTVTAVAAGSATVTVTATNMSGSEQQEFAVEVRLPAPLAIGAIADVALREDGLAREIELADQFGGVVEGYDASATPAGVVHVWESGGRLTLTPLASGVAVVTVTATNAGGVAQQAFLATVRDGAPRALGTTPLVEIVEGEHSIIGVSSYFDGEGVTFAAESSRPGVVTVEAHGETTVVSGLAVGIALVTVTATNEAGSAAQELVVVVSRRAPEVRDGIEALTLTSGGAARTIDLSIHFSGSLTRFGAIAERTGIVHLWESAGRLTFTPLAAGSSTVTVWSANTGGTASQTFDVSVRPRAPRALASSTLLTLSMDGRPLSVELANYFGGDVERYALAATPGGVVHHWESGGLLTLTPLAAGLATLEVTALNAGGSAEQQFTVVVQPAAPTALGRIVAAPLAAGGAGQEIALADYFDGEVAHYEVVSRPDGILHLWESHGRLRLTPLSAGVATVTVTAINGSGSASQIFAVAVAPAAPQTPGRAERIALAEGGAVREIDLGDYFGGEAARYHLTADRGGVVHGWESAGRLTLTPLAAGVATVVVTATNSAGSAEQPFIVTVDAAAPEALGRLEGSTLNEAGESHEIELADYFSGAIARYRVLADPAGVVHAWVSEGRLTLTPLAAGVATVAVTASNEGGSARQEFAVVVE